MKKLYLGLILTFFCVQSIFAQNITKQSYEKAREVLDKAVAAYGGLENLRSIQNFSLKAVGDTVQRNQSRRTFYAERTPYQINVIVDMKGNRFMQVAQGGYPGGFKYHSGLAVDKTDGVSFDFVRNTSTARPNIPPAAIRFRMRWLPQYWVLNAVERASRLRYLGRVEFDKRMHNAVSYANEDGAENTLYFDEKTNLLSKFEGMGTDVFFGDVVFEMIYTGYRNENGHQVPTGRITKTGDELTEELRFEQIAFNTTLSDDKFKAPNGMKAVALAPPPQPLNKLTENVYTVNAGGYNVLFVAFKDYIFVMEAPGNDNVSRSAIEQIKKTFPDKPIRYIAVTHHHDDHAGGLRTYIAEGATLIAAPGEKSFFERIAKSKFTIDPDTLTRNPQPLKIETIAGGKRVLTDGTTTVEIYDIGSGPHTDEMLVAYLPNEKILFQGDLLNRPSNGDYPIANDTTVHFAKWLESKKLAVDKIVAVHGTVSTMDELRTAVAEKEKTQK
ncbi:MAG TPA: MBL fold metallo-hydrolase [Pyrinomonadaceae bacterium]|jgi:glyoxylase-like metal-dependent hydrolase (beta-lactamase superfamily II)